MHAYTKVAPVPLMSVVPKIRMKGLKFLWRVQNSTCCVQHRTIMSTATALAHLLLLAWQQVSRYTNCTMTWAQTCWLVPLGYIHTQCKRNYKLCECPESFGDLTSGNKNENEQDSTQPSPAQGQETITETITLTTERTTTVHLSSIVTATKHVFIHFIHIKMIMNHPQLQHLP